MESTREQPIEPEAQEKIAAMRAIARKYEGIDLSPKQEHFQFGNNFFLLFRALMLKEQGQKSDLEKIYLKKAEAHGKSWENFLQVLKNTGFLWPDMKRALEKQEDTLKLFKAYKWLVFKSNNSVLTEEIAREIHLNEILHFVWRELNPLLEKAAAAMIEAGINPESFYG